MNGKTSGKHGDDKNKSGKTVSRKVLKHQIHAEAVVKTLYGSLWGQYLSIDIKNYWYQYVEIQHLLAVAHIFECKSYSIPTIHYKCYW